MFRRLRFRFSLRTLLLLMLLIGSGAALHYRWEPWALVREIEGRYASFSPDGQQMLVLENGKTNAARISVRDALGTTERFSIKLSESRGEVNYARWVSGGHWIEVKTELAAAHPGYGLLRTELFDAANGKSLFPNGAPKRVRFSIDEKFFLATFVDGRCGIWDATKGEFFAPANLNSFKKFYPAENTDEEVASCLVLAPGGKRVAASWNDKTLICDARTGDKLQEFDGTMLGNGDELFSPDGQLLLYRSVDQIRVRKDENEWIIPNGLLLLRKGSYSPDATKLAVVDGFSFKLRIFDVNTHQEVTHAERINQTPVAAGIWSPDGLILAETTWRDVFVGFDGTKTELGKIVAVAHDRKRCLVNKDSAWQIKETRTGEILCSLDHVGEYDSAEFSRNDKRIAISDYQNKVQIFEQRRYETRVGVLSLPELWITLVLAVSSIWSLRRDWKEMRKTT